MLHRIRPVVSVVVVVAAAAVDRIGFVNSLVAAAAAIAAAGDWAVGIRDLEKPR